MINTKQLTAYIQNVGETMLSDNLIATTALSDINQVFYANGINNDISTATNLSVRYVSEDEFKKAFTKDGAQIEPKTLYVVSADVINAYNTNIKNVASPVESCDASNKEYVDSTVEQAKDDILTTTDEKYVDLSSIQTITGKKTFYDGLDIGDNIYDVGNNSFAVGTDLTVGSYNFYYKGVDINKAALSGRIYLCAKQPRYPYPFYIENGNKTKFRMTKKDIDVNNQSTLSNMYYSPILNGLWFLSAQYGSNPPYRDDYSQLSIDLGDNYWTDITSTLNKIREYLDDAFTEDTSLSIYNLRENIKKDFVITMVNSFKAEYLRCGTVIEAGDGYIDVQFTDTAMNSSNGFAKSGIVHNDLDFDDASLVFIDYPTLLGPSNESTYSSLNVGAENTVLRRCSMAAGKENRTESDFCIALGRKAQANHYNSFVWAPNTKIKSPDNHTFTIGLKDTIDNCKLSSSTKRTLYVADSNGKSEELHSFIWGCLSSNPSMLSSFFDKNKTDIKNWLGL